MSSPMVEKSSIADILEVAVVGHPLMSATIAPIIETVWAGGVAPLPFESVHDVNNKRL